MQIFLANLQSMNIFGSFGRWHGVAALTVGLALIAASAAIIRMLFISRSQQVTSPPHAPVETQLHPTTSSITSQTTPTANWKTYTDHNGRYSLRYPSSYRFGENEIVSPPSKWGRAVRTITLYCKFAKYI